MKSFCANQHVVQGSFRPSVRLSVSALLRPWAQDYRVVQKTGPLYIFQNIYKTTEDNYTNFCTRQGQSILNMSIMQV